MEMFSKNVCHSPGNGIRCEMDAKWQTCDYWHSQRLDKESYRNILISAHKMLKISESTILKFNHSDYFVLSTTLIYKHRLQ